MTYAELQAAIAAHMDRSDLSSFIPDFIAQAESLFNYGADGIPALRCREMESVETLPIVDGAGAVPDDFLQFVRAVAGSGARWPLEYITPDAADRLYPSQPGGAARHCSIVGNTFRVYPGLTGDAELTYYAAIPALSDSLASNWLLAKAPSLYLRASLMAAYDFVRDQAATATQAQMAQSLMAGINRSDMVGRYARASLQLRTVSP